MEKKKGEEDRQNKDLKKQKINRERTETKYKSKCIQITLLGYFIASVFQDKQVVKYIVCPSFTVIKNK